MEDGEQGDGDSSSPGGLLRSMFPRSTRDMREVVEWVFDNLDLSDVTPADAPSPGAWAFREQLRQYPLLRIEFYKTIWPRFLSKVDEGDGGRLNDDGRDVLRTIAEVQRLRDSTRSAS